MIASFAAPQPSQGATNVPMWRSLDPHSERNSFQEIHNQFTLSMALVKVSFGERGGTYIVFQKKLRENAYFYL